MGSHPGLMLRVFAGPCGRGAGQRLRPMLLSRVGRGSVRATGGLHPLALSCPPPAPLPLAGGAGSPGNRLGRGGGQKCGEQLGTSRLAVPPL